MNPFSVSVSSFMLESRQWYESRFGAHYRSACPTSFFSTIPTRRVTLDLKPCLQKNSSKP